MSKITIAIPTYNREDYLQECLQSVLNQTFQDYEIIIFDNHSDYDITGLVYSLNDGRVKLVQHETNLGNQGNFKKIFQYKYQTEFLVVFHDDDTMRPDFLEKNIDFLQKNDDVIFAISLAHFVSKEQKMSDFFKAKKIDYFQNITSPVEFVRLILRGYDFCFDSAIYRTRFLDDIGRFYEQFGKWSDRPYLINLSEKGKVAFSEDKFINYRIHSSQDSQKSSEELPQAIAYSKALFAFYKSKLGNLSHMDDIKLFNSFAANNVISFAGNYAHNINALLGIIQEFRDSGFFNWHYIGFRGIFYFIKSLCKLASPKI